MRYERGIYVIVGVAGIAANAMWISFIIAAFIPEPIGKAGGNDYSMWKSTFTPTYAALLEKALTEHREITAAITCSNTAVAPLSSNSSSSLFYQTPLINHLSLPRNSNSSASIGSSGSLHDSIYGKDHFNGKNSKHHDSYCNYSDYKSNIMSCS